MNQQGNLTVGWAKFDSLHDAYLAQLKGIMHIYVDLALQNRGFRWKYALLAAEWDKSD